MKELARVLRWGILVMVLAVAALGYRYLADTQVLTDPGVVSPTTIEATSPRPAPETPITVSVEPDDEPRVVPVSESLLDSWLAPLSLTPPDDEKYDGKIIAEYGDLVRVRRLYRNCRDTNRGFQCDTVHEFDHPYNGFSHDELVSIAKFDAAASFILAHRIFHGGNYKKYYGDDWYQAGVNYYVDATILSDSPQPYQSMLATRGLSGIRHQNGRLVISHLQQSYAWRKAGIDLGILPKDDSGFYYLRQFINENRSDYPEINPDAWDRDADDIRRMIEKRKALIIG